MPRLAYLPTRMKFWFHDFFPLFFNYQIIESFLVYNRTYLHPPPTMTSSSKFTTFLHNNGFQHGLPSISHNFLVFIHDCPHPLLQAFELWSLITSKLFFFNFFFLFICLANFSFPQKCSRNSQIFTRILFFYFYKKPQKIQNFLKLFPNFWCGKKKEKKIVNFFFLYILHA